MYNSYYMGYECYAVGEALALIFFCKSCREIDEENNERIRKKNFENVLKQMRKKFEKEKKMREINNIKKEKKYDELQYETEKEMIKQYQEIEKNKKLFHLKEYKKIY